MKEIRELINFLNKCTKYYDLGEPIISDKEWDDKYYLLKSLEKKFGIYYPDSPTQSVNYEIVNELVKKEHNHDMLSLDKTKDISDIENFLKGFRSLAMSKMDGLTCSLLYNDGILISAETRGNGKIGEDITHNIKVLKNIPTTIPIKEELIIDGEVICTYEDFESSGFNLVYKNPRNFAAGSIRLLNSSESKTRNLTFVAWDVIKGFENKSYLSEKLQELKNIGFTICPYKIITNNKIDNTIQAIIDESKKLSYPIDGIVFKFDDIAYGASLGKTAHHFKNAIAYKFYDETYPTNLLDIEWTMGRTGILTPVAIFNPVEIDGTTISKANLHNISILQKTLGKFPHKNQPIEVYKSNQIIPQIYSADCIEEQTELYYKKNPKLFIPNLCPECGKKTTRIVQENDSSFLICTNKECEGKLINKLEHFFGKKGLDVKGLSVATLEKLIDWGWVSNIKDLYELEKYKKDWIEKPGFGEKSVNNILNAISVGRECELYQLISAIGIPLVGVNISKELTKHFNSWNSFITAINNNFDFTSIHGFGEEIDKSLKSFDYSEIIELLNKYIIIKSNEKVENDKKVATNKIFVITGTLKYFKNRDELKKFIESIGGKVVNSISNNTSYLINNDLLSNSTKNKKAKELKIPIISEEKFLEIFS